MSSREPTVVDLAEVHTTFPQFDLEYLFDDDENPSEVTIFSDDVDQLSTAWITADRADCWPLEDCR